MMQIQTDVFPDPIHVTRVIRRGKRNWLFEGRIHGERYVLKLANLKSNSRGSAAFDVGSEWFSDISFQSSDFMSARREVESRYSRDRFCKTWDGHENKSYYSCDDFVLNGLLYSEYETLKRVGDKWNASVFGIGNWYPCAHYGQTVPGLSDLDLEHLTRKCIILPYYEGQPLGKFSAQDRARLWLSCLLSLWQALEVSAHGDLNLDNLLISADQSFFRLIDPCSLCALVEAFGRPDHFRGLKETVFFVTTPSFYALYQPFSTPYYRRKSPSYWLFGGAWHFLDPLQANAGDIPGAFFLREATSGNDRTCGFAPLAICDWAEEPFPSAADRCAMGLITYHLLTGDSLVIPDLTEEPAWTGSFTSRGDYFQDYKVDTVKNAVTSGYLKEKLARIADQNLQRLIEGLVTLRISTREELEIFLPDGVENFPHQPKQ